MTAARQMETGAAQPVKRIQGMSVCTHPCLVFVHLTAGTARRSEVRPVTMAAMTGRAAMHLATVRSMDTRVTERRQMSAHGLAEIKSRLPMSLVSTQERFHRAVAQRVKKRQGGAAMLRFLASARRFVEMG